jgi:uncharacterized protein with GYD domain
LRHRDPEGVRSDAARQEERMPKYMATGHYSPDGAKGLLAEGGTGRRAATEKLLASLGGKMEAYYFSFGSDDFVLIADLPSNTAAAAASLTAAATGAIVSRIVVLLTPEEIDAATKMTPDYRAPGG